MPVMTANPALGALDLSRLPPFRLVEVDYEAERAAMVAGVAQRMAAWGFDFDAAALESEPAIALIEEVAFRRTLALQAINDAGKRLSVQYAWGAALDSIAATFYADMAVARLASEPDTPAGDDRFRRRILLSAEARSPGTLAGYEYWALTFAPHLVDVRAYNHASGLARPGEILIVLLGDAADEGPAGEAAQIALAAAGLRDRAVQLGTDHLVIRAATRTTVAIEAVLELASGPDQALVLQAAVKSLDAYRADRRRVGKVMTISGLHAALTVGAVEKVRLVAPAADVDPGLDGVVDVTAASLSAEAANG